MFRFMVVDDEPIAAQSVVYMIEKNFSDAENAGVCSSGKEAIERALGAHPDIVFMDIDMPGINGLAAIRQIQSVSPGTTFLVVTAFDYFDYAVEAMTLGVTEYLVKPVKEAKLVSTLNTALAGLAQKRTERQKALEQQERLEMAIPMLEEGFHNALRLPSEGAEDLEKYCRLLGFRNMGGFVLIAEFRSVSGEPLAQTEKRHDAVSSLMKRAGDCIVGPWRHDRVAAYYFDDADERNEDALREDALHIAQTILRGLRQEDAYVVIGIGHHYESVGDGRRSYQQARRALQIINESGNRNVALHVDDVVDNKLRQPVHFRQQLEEALFARAEQNDGVGVRAVLEKLFSRMQQEPGATLEGLKSGMAQLIQSFAKRYDIPEDTYRAALSDIAQAGSESALLFAVREYLGKTVSALTSARQNAINGLIEKANRYIRAHYAEQLSLDDVAREVNLSSPYFSRLYKRETGVNFSDKLAQVRIDRAKELLNREDLSVKEIAYLVGYQEPNYFSRIFKKLTGRTASDYKKDF